MNVIKPISAVPFTEHYEDGGFVNFNGEGQARGAIYRLELVCEDAVQGNHLFKLKNFDESEEDEFFLTTQQMEAGQYISISEPRDGYFENMLTGRDTLDNPTPADLLPVHTIGQTKSELGLIPNPTRKFLDVMREMMEATENIRKKVTIKVVDLLSYNLEIPAIDPSKMQ